MTHLVFYGFPQTEIKIHTFIPNNEATVDLSSFHLGRSIKQIWLSTTVQAVHEFSQIRTDNTSAKQKTVQDIVLNI